LATGDVSMSAASAEAHPELMKSKNFSLCGVRDLAESRALMGCLSELFTGSFCHCQSNSLGDNED